jgi:hypothetical protein
MKTCDFFGQLKRTAKKKEQKRKKYLLTRKRLRGGGGEGEAGDLGAGLPGDLATAFACGCHSLLQTKGGGEHAARTSAGGRGGGTS